MYKILMPIDGSVHSRKALHVAGDLAMKYGARVLLLHVLSPQMAAAKGKDAERKSEAHKILDSAASWLRARMIEFQTLPLAVDHPVEAILAAQAEFGASAIVMGSRGVGHQQGGSFGSVSHAVFERADCTCISVK